MISEKNEKILGVFLLVVLISCLVYLIFFASKNANKTEVEMIKINGNNLLTEEEYLKSANLADSSLYKKLTLSEIKARIDKHPYLKNVDVEYEGNNLVNINLTEKKIKAIIINNGEPYFISDDFEILPMIEGTKFSDLPVISNAVLDNHFSPLTYQKNEGLIEAFKIIDAAKLTNDNISKRISEINLRNGGDIILTFSGMKPPVIFGKGQLPKKMIYFEIMLEGITNGNSLVDNSDYIDLRFADEIYIGKSEGTGLSE